MNPIMQLLNQRNPMLAMMQPIYNAMRNVGNPIAAIGQMAANDERMQQVMNVIQQNGSVQQAVYSEAQKRNVNPNDALNQARQMMQSMNIK